MSGIVGGIVCGNTVEPSESTPYDPYMTSAGSTAGISGLSTGLKTTNVLTLVYRWRATAAPVGFERQKPFEFYSGVNDRLHTGLRPESTVFVNVKSGSNANLYDVTTNQTTAHDGEIHTLLFSFDGVNAVGHLYMDDASDNTTGFAPVVGDCVFDTASYCIGRGVSTDRFKNEIGMLGVAPVYIDFSIESNRRKFFDAEGGPIEVNEITWDAFGGVEPYYWNEHGNLFDNKGALPSFVAGQSNIGMVNIQE